SIGAVEPTCDLASELEVRRLVATYRNDVALHDDDVCALKDGILKQPEVDVVGLVPDLLLEGWHPLHPAEGGDHREKQGQLGHLGDRRLPVQHSAFGVDADGDQIHDYVVQVVREVAGD